MKETLHHVSAPNKGLLPDKVHKYHALASVGYAFAGIKQGFLSEKNIIFQVTIGFVSIAISLAFSRWQFVLAHILCLGIVVSFELVNTAFEYLCDLVKPEYSNQVKSIKDIAAGAVLFTALMWLAIIVVEAVFIIFDIKL